MSELSDSEIELLNSNLNGAIRISKLNRQLETKDKIIAELKYMIDGFILLDTHAPFCRFPIEECSNQCMDRKHYNITNLVKLARETLAKIKEIER